jgi:hypothetical protein
VPPKKKPTVKELIAGAKLPERSVSVCLHADLTAQMGGLERQLAVAEGERAAGAGSLASGSRSRVISEQINALREVMLEHTLEFRVRALPRHRFTALRKEHPPREGNAFDAAAETNLETLTEALVRACVVEPELDDADWAALDENFSDAQWQLLANAAWAVCARDVAVPFSRSASRILQTSDDE